MSTNVLEGCLRLLPFIWFWGWNAYVWHRTKDIENESDKWFPRVIGFFMVGICAVGVYPFWRWVLEGFGVL